MSLRSDVSPSTLGIRVTDEGITVEYLDNRETVYSSPVEQVPGEVRCQPGKEVHVLVTDQTETEGAIVYVNDRRTDAEILETTGVGRVMLEPGAETEFFPGVTVRMDGHAVVVEAAPSIAGGRVFVFEEDEMGERAYEIIEE